MRGIVLTGCTDWRSDPVTAVAVGRIPPAPICRHLSIDTDHTSLGLRPKTTTPAHASVEFHADAYGHRLVLNHCMRRGSSAHVGVSSPDRTRGDDLLYDLMGRSLGSGTATVALAKILGCLGEGSHRRDDRRRIDTEQTPS